MAEHKTWQQLGDGQATIRPGAEGQVIRIDTYVLKGSTGNNAQVRFHTGELTAIAISDGGTGYTAAATKAYAVGDGKRVELGAVTVAAGVITAIAIPTFTHGFSAAPAIVIEGDGEDAAATGTITERDYDIRTTTGLNRGLLQLILTRDMWAEIEADDGDDYVFISGVVLP